MQNECVLGCWLIDRACTYLVDVPSEESYFFLMHRYQKRWDLLRFFLLATISPSRLEMMWAEEFDMVDNPFVLFLPPAGGTSQEASQHESP